MAESGVTRGGSSADEPPTGNVLGALAAMMPDRDRGAGRAPVSARNWRATVIGLHASFAGLIGLATVALLVDPVPGAAQYWALGSLAALAVAYLVAGAPALTQRTNSLAMAYLTVAVVAVGIIAWAAPGSLFLLFLVYPQIWFLVPAARLGIVWTALLALTSGGGLTAAAVSAGQSPLAAWTSSGIGLVFSVLMGTWISRVLEQSRQRAELIGQLEETRAELAAAHHEQGVMAERERFAQEVHDTLAQGYTSIVMLAQTALTHIDARPAAARERLELIEEVARENLGEARRVVAAFAPPALDGATLIEALRRLADRFERETGVMVEATLPREIGLDRDAEVVLLRAAQEALTNVRRHAAAHAVRLSLTAGDGVELVVRDDGVGFEPAVAAGNGLTGLRSRVSQAHGSVRIESLVGAGTMVAVRLPDSVRA